MLPLSTHLFSHWSIPLSQRKLALNSRNALFACKIIEAPTVRYIKKWPRPLFEPKTNNVIKSQIHLVRQSL
jgi:hypothetical protein